MYVVIAHRMPHIYEYRGHQYVIGVFSKKQKAINVAKIEYMVRGGKYVCEIVPIENNEKANYEKSFIIDKVDKNSDKGLLKMNKYKDFV